MWSVTARSIKRRETRTRVRVVLGGTLVAALIAATATTVALGAPGGALSPEGTTVPPNLSVLLGGFHDYWTASGRGDLQGTVKDTAVLQRNDELAVWINQHATPQEKFVALQDSEYNTEEGTYDQSITVSTGLGSIIGAAYVQGRIAGKLPLVSALINSTDGTSGAFLSTGTPKGFFSYPRPFLPASPTAAPVAGDVLGCSPSVANGSSLTGIRAGMPWADAQGDLDITRVPPVTDGTHRFSPNNVPLDAAYGTTGICGGGSFPSGHTTTAYQAGITLATLLPELAPEILARTSENGNSRIVLGVHYPLDIMGGRISGEAALAARWSDPVYRTRFLEPARAELLRYLKKATGHDLATDIANQTPYRSNPYNGAQLPGGTAQIVTDRASALTVYTERLNYGFPASGTKGRAPSVPAGASNLLLTTFPTLTDAQRTAVLAQTELGSGYPLDQTGTAGGSWERLNLAAAMSATVRVAANGDVKVTATGGTARVIRA